MVSHKVLDNISLSVFCHWWLSSQLAFNYELPVGLIVSLMSLMFDRNPLKPLTQLVRGIAYLLADAEDGGELIGTTGQLF